MPSQPDHNDPPGSTRNPQEFFSWFEVSYADNQPADAISEIHGKAADINDGFEGSYVWLTVRRAPRPGHMVDNIWVDVSDSRDEGRDDLAKGAGGDYRYLAWSNDMTASHYITDVALWRTGDEESGLPAGWHHKSRDINRGRGGDCLYLVWRTKEYCGPKGY